MGIIREPLDVDFVVEPMTEEDRRAIRIAVLESKKRLKIEEKARLRPASARKNGKAKPAMPHKTKILA